MPVIMVTRTHFPREPAPMLWFCSTLASTSPQLMPIKTTAGPAVWSQPPPNEGTNAPLERGDWWFIKKAGVLQRWKDGGEYKMLLKEIEIRAIRWCRLAVCVKTHPALAPGLRRVCVSNQSQTGLQGWTPASTHCPQQLRGIWSTNHTAPEVLVSLKWDCFCPC